MTEEELRLLAQARLRLQQQSATPAPLDMTRAGNPTPAPPAATPRPGLEWNPATQTFERAVPAPVVPNEVPPGFVPYSGPDTARTRYPHNAGTDTRDPNERAFELGLQGAGAGIADAVGAPIDLVNAFFNLIYSGANRVLGTEIPLVDRPLGGSQSIRDAATAVAEPLGLQVLDQEQMTPDERLRYDISRTGTAAAVGGGALARGAGALRPAGTVTQQPRAVDALLAPYATTPGRAFSGDVAAGAGAGAANFAYNEYVPEAVQERFGPIGTVLANVMGGVGGATTLSAGESLVRRGATAVSGAVNGTRATELPPNAVTGEPWRRADIADAADIVQGQASGWGRNNDYAPMLAAAEIEGMQNRLGHFAGPDSLPTAGISSGNPGLIGLEQRQRTQTPSAFVPRDNAVRQAAVDTASRIAPANATGRQFTDEVAALDADRVAGAAFLRDEAQQQLRAAEAAGAADAAPVAVPFPREARAEAALGIDETVVDKTMRPMQDVSAQMFAKADPDRTAILDVTPAIGAAERVRGSLGVLADPSTVIPAGLLGRIERTAAAPEVDGMGAAIRGAELSDNVPATPNAIDRYWQQRDALDPASMTDAQWRKKDAELLRATYTDESEILDFTYQRQFENDLAEHIREVDAGGGRPPGDGTDGRPPTPQDILYRGAFSAMARIPLRRGETWRSRAMNILARARAEQLRGQPAGQAASPTLGMRIRDAELSDDDPGVLGDLGIGGDAAPLPEVSVGDIVAVWPEISRSIDAARRSGNYALADNLQALRDGLNQAIDIAADEGNDAAQRAVAARQNWQATLGTTFGRDAPVSQQLRRDYNLNRGGRSETPPSQTAGQYLRTGQPERAVELQNIIAKSSDPAAGQAAVHSYLMNDLAAAGVLDRSGYLRPDALRRWRDKWGVALDISPETRAAVDDLIARADSGGLIRGEALAGFDAANNLLTDVQRNKGAFAAVLGNNPENAVNAIFSSGDPERVVAQILEQIGTNQSALDGFKASIREYMQIRMTTSAVGATTDGANPLAFGKLDTLFKRHENTLAMIFSPDEMEALQASRDFLRPLDSLRQGALPGSQTAERSNRFWELLEVGLKARYGVLKGGGLLRTVRLWAKTLPNNESAVNQIIAQMMFDPELAKHLLRAPRSAIDTPRYNRRLNQLLGVAAGARDAQDKAA